MTLRYGSKEEGWWRDEGKGGGGGAEVWSGDDGNGETEGEDR